MKWPKIYHLPSSLGVTNEDRVLDDVGCFLSKEVVIMEKLDGECTSMHSDKVHARSEDSRHHDSRSWAKALHGNIRWMIPGHIQIVGENMYAEHSIYYDELSTYFYTFAAIDKERLVVLSVDETLEWCERLGVEHAPIIYRGTFPEHFTVPSKSAFASEAEGYVLRVAEEFPIVDFASYIAKWVRKGHVQTDVFWMENWTPNKLATGRLL